VLVDVQPTDRPQNPPGLGQGPLRVRHRAQHLGEDDGVDARAVHRQVLGVGVHDVDDVAHPGAASGNGGGGPALGIWLYGHEMLDGGRVVPEQRSAPAPHFDHLTRDAVEEPSVQVGQCGVLGPLDSPQVPPQEYRHHASVHWRDR